MGTQQPLALQLFPAQQGWPGLPQATPVVDVPPAPPLPMLASERPPAPPAAEDPPPSPPVLLPPLPPLFDLLLLHPTSHSAAMPTSKLAPIAPTFEVVPIIRVVISSLPV